MISGKPPALPPGYLSLQEALDRVDPGDSRNVGTPEEQRAFEKWIGNDANFKAAIETLTVPPSIGEEGSRRVRRRAAFEEIQKLCAYGVVPSGVLLDDFTHYKGVPTENWLDDRLSSEMRNTGRTTLKGRHYSERSRSGWVTIDAAALDGAVAARVGASILQLTKEPAGMLGNVVDQSDVRAEPVPTLGRGRTQRETNGLDYGPHDAPLVVEMRKLIEGKMAGSPEDAARAVVSRAVGAGQDGSKVKRLALRYRKTYPLQPVE